jgi:hypothetical protein
MSAEVKGTLTPAICADLFGGDAEPALTAYDHRTLVLKDGKGGICRFDSSEAADVVKQFTQFVQNDAPPVTIVDLRTAPDTV